MLSIRYLRVGRRNSAFFRVVLTEKSKPANSGFQKVLGWYNPHTKEASLNKEEILKYIDNGAVPSNSVAKLLIDNKITHKNIQFVKDAPGKTKKKQLDKPATPKAQTEDKESDVKIEDVEKTAQEEAKAEVEEAEATEIPSEGGEPIEEKTEESTEKKVETDSGQRENSEEGQEEKK